MIDGSDSDELLNRPITPAEMRVFQMVIDGLANKVIAGSLDITTKTVEVHRSRVVKKLGARNTAHAIALAFRRGILR